MHCHLCRTRLTKIQNNFFHYSQVRGQRWNEMINICILVRKQNNKNKSGLVALLLHDNCIFFNQLDIWKVPFTNLPINTDVKRQPKPNDSRRGRLLGVGKYKLSICYSNTNYTGRPRNVFIYHKPWINPGHLKSVEVPFG